MAKTYLKKIISFYARHKRMPSYSEILRITGLRSKNSVFKLVSKLISSGQIAKDSSGRLIPGKLFNDVRVLGIIEAGFPSPAEEELIDTMSLDEFLIRNKEATYILKVNGESMIDAGIMPEDMVLVERGREAKNGDIVIAEVDGQWTMKYFQKEGQKICLLPANKKFKPIYPTGDLKITAVVRAVIRKY